MPKPLKPTRNEIFRLKDKEGQSTFHDLTSSTNFLSSVFSLDSSFSHRAMIFYKRIKSIIHRSFKKVRINKAGKPKKITNVVQLVLHKKRELKSFLSHCKCSETMKKLEKDIESIDQYCT